MDRNLYEILNITREDILDETGKNYSSRKLDDLLKNFDSKNLDLELRKNLSREVEYLIKYGLDKYDKMVLKKQTDDALSMFNIKSARKKEVSQNDDTINPNKLHVYDKEKLKTKCKLAKEKIIALIVAGAIVIGGLTIVHAYNKEKVASSDVGETGDYSDADELVKMETIEYIAGPNISTVAEVAEDLGISLDECISLENPKVGSNGLIFKLSVPEKVAKEYNEKQSVTVVKEHFVCYYETPSKFSSLIDVAYDIIDEYPAFAEGEQYTKDGKTPANYLAKCLIEDNPNMGNDFRNMQAGSYRLNFYGTDSEYEQMIKEGKLPKPASISKN